MGAAQVPQEAPANAVPQLEQKRPLSAAPQEGQTEGAGEAESVDTLER